MTCVGPAFVPRLARRARLRFDRLEGRLMILYPERGLLLNESGGAIAAMCDGKRSAGEIAAALAQALGAERRVVERDVLKFLGELTARGVLE